MACPAPGNLVREGAPVSAVDYNEVFRQAREAADRGDFERARRLYGELWRSPLWQNDQEVQSKYAYSCERTGDYTEALAAYKSLMNTYSRTPPDEQALVEESMVRLRELMAEGERDASNRVLDMRGSDSLAGMVPLLFGHAYERQLEPGFLLCQVGDPAYHMWLLTRGEMDVLVPGAPTSRLASTPERPCLMGELAYFTGMRRAATLCCATHATVLELPYDRIAELAREDARIQSMLDHLFRERLLMQVLSQHEIFKQVRDDDRRTIALSFERMSVNAAEVLVEQGKEHDGAYMVQSGLMLLIRVHEDGREELMGSVHPGDMMHLGGLLRGFLPGYRIVAGAPSQLLRLSRERFEPLMKKRPWLISAILRHSRMPMERQIMHPEARNLWAANRYIDLE